MSKREDWQRLKAHLAQNTTTAFVLDGDEAEDCLCYFLQGGSTGIVKMIWHYALCKLAELCVIGWPKNFFYRLAGVKIGRKVIISPGVVLDYLCCDLIEIGDGCVLGMGCMITAHEFTHQSSRVGRVRLGKNVTVGVRAVIRSGIAVGDGAVIGMMSLVTKDVAAKLTVAGVPAKPLTASREADL